ncbi:MAG: hypothetical protein ACREMG_11275 [Gemmatimonadales bacterium]
MTWVLLVWFLALDGKVSLQVHEFPTREACEVWRADALVVPAGAVAGYGVVAGTCRLVP